MIYGRPVCLLATRGRCSRNARTISRLPEHVSRSRARRGEHYRGDSLQRIGRYGYARILRTSLVKLDNSLPLNAQTGHQAFLAKNERIDI